MKTVMLYGPAKVPQFTFQSFQTSNRSPYFNRSKVDVMVVEPEKKTSRPHINFITVRMISGYAETSLVIEKENK